MLDIKTYMLNGEIKAGFNKEIIIAPKKTSIRSPIQSFINKFENN